MKKLSILALAALLVVAFTIPAAALENEFGGYWRTRMYSQGHFDGEDGDDGSWRRVDTRTRLYYTAKINDNLKFVNKFEFDGTWGSTAGSRSAAGTGNRAYTEVGADGANIEIKNSYADFNLGPVNFTVGVQPYMLFRTAYIDDDASGVIARWKVLDNFVLAGSWLKAFDGGAGQNNADIDSYTIGAGIWFSENISLKPAINWLYSSGTVGDFAGLAGSAATSGELNRYTYGFDFDADFDAFSVWATAYGQAGDLENGAYDGSDLDFKGYLAIVGGNVMLGPVDLHGQIIYASGDDDPLDDELESVSASSAFYYWAEIIGLGIFDNDTPTGVPAGNIANITAGGIGVTLKPMDKLSLTTDVWYAELTEDDIFGENEIGTELDVKVTYQLVEGLNLDLVGAYLWAGDAVSTDGSNDEDPYEIGARLSLSF
jgi:hypothetical protein